MKKLLLLLLLAASVLSPAASAQTTTTLTGTVRDLSNAAVTSGQVSFTLQPGIDTAMSGTARFTPSEIDCTITGAGAVKALDGVSTCTVVNNTAISQPSGTSYKVCIQPQFIQPGSCFVWYATGGSVDITQQVPTPPLTPAYNLVDTFSNQTVGGNKTFSGTVTYAGTVVMGSVTASGLLSGLGIVDTGDLTMQQPNVATSGVNQSSNNFKIKGNYWNGSASAVDQWLLQDILGAGSNPTSTLTLTHSGSSGEVNVSLPNASISGLVSAYTSAGELIGKYSTISAAYAALPSGNGRIEPSCGIYSENLTLTTSVTISGVDKTCVHVRPATTANPTISINATSVSAIDGIVIENLSMECQALPLSVACGDGIFITGSQTTNQVNDHITLRDMVIGNMYQLNTLGTFGFNNGIEITGRAIWISIERVQQNNGRNIGLKIALTGGLVGPVNGLHVISSSFFGNFNAGISVDCNGSISSCVTNEFDLTEATANGQNTALTPCAGWIFNGVWDERLHNAYAEANCPGSGDANSAQIRITGSSPSPNQIDISTFTFSMTAGAAKWGIYNDASRSSGTYDGLRFIGPTPATGSVHFANTSPDSHTVILNATALIKPDIIADAFGNTHVSIPAAGILAKTVINNANCPLATNKFDLYTGCTGVEWSMNSIGVTGGPATINNFTSGLPNQTLQVCSDSGVITLANAAGGAGQMNLAAAANKLLQTNECIQLRRLVASDAWQEMLATAAPKVLAQPGTIASPPITWAANPGDGFQQQSGGAGTISMTLGGVHQILWGAALQRMRASHVVGWSSNTDPSAAQADTALCRAAANVLEVSTSESCNANGSIKPAAVVSGGAAATLTGTGACATFSTQTGGSMAGRATCTGTTGASTLTITPGTTAPTGWVCYVQDQTTRANLFQQTSNTTGGCTLTVTSVTQNDVFVFTAIAF